MKLRRFAYPSREAAEFVGRLHARQAQAALDASPEALRKAEQVFGKPLAPIAAVRHIIADVRSEGDAAVSRYTRAFDGVDIAPSRFRVGHGRLKQAFEDLERELRSSLLRARRAIEAYQQALLPADVLLEPAAGIQLHALFRPFRRVGIYVPGGKAAYPSSVLMNAVPAVVAGVSEIAVFTPPEPPPAVLAACHIAGVSEVYRVGGVQAIAAMAYGTESIPAVEFIAGPGNIYVSLAKREVFGTVGIDMLAGPSEVMIIADGSADAALVAADMLAQAEHDALASASVASTHPPLLEALERQLARQLDGRGRSDVAAASLAVHGAAFAVADLEAACQLANQVAPEHLEIMTERPAALLPLVRTAGAVFLGASTPEALGDYVAGPSHTLPTGGTARFSSGLSALSFLRRMSVVEYDGDALADARDDLLTLAAAEGLPYHAASVKARYAQVGDA